MEQKYFFYFLIAMPFFGSASALDFGTTVAKDSNGFNVTFHFMDLIVNAISDISDEFVPRFLNCLKETYDNEDEIIGLFSDPLARILSNMFKEGFGRISEAVENEIKNLNPNIVEFFHVMKYASDELRKLREIEDDFYEKLSAIMNITLLFTVNNLASLNSVTFRKLSDVALDEVQMAVLRGFNYTENEDENATLDDEGIFPILGEQVSCVLKNESTQLTDALFKALGNEFKDNSTIKFKFFCPFGSTLSELQKQFENLSADEKREIGMLTGINEFFELCGRIGNKHAQIVKEQREGEEIGEAITTTYAEIAQFLATKLKHPRTRLSKAILHKLQDIFFNVLENSQECPTLSIKVGGLQQVRSDISGLLTDLKESSQGVSDLSILL